MDETVGHEGSDDRQRARERAETERPQNDAREPPSSDAGYERPELVVGIRHYVTFSGSGLKALGSLGFGLQALGFRL